MSALNRWGSWGTSSIGSSETTLSTGRVRVHETDFHLPALGGALARTKALPETPELHIQPEALAPYARVDEVLAITKRVGVDRMGFVGNEQYREF